MNVQPYLDHRNKALWQELSSYFTITLAQSEDATYGIYTKGKQATIYVPSTSPCPDSFTHELLHLLISKKEVYITGSLIRSLQASEFTGIFKPDLAEHIGNCLEHTKMLPLYLALGFNRSKFLFDYNENKYSSADRYLIETYIREPNRLWSHAVNNYVAKYFAMNACPNEGFDYSTPLYSLQTLEPNLYQILDQCWADWKNLDLDVSDSIYNNYQTVSFGFISSLEEWVTRKRMEGFPFKLQ
jgi:hypothetical protein